MRSRFNMLRSRRSIVTLLLSSLALLVACSGTPLSPSIFGGYWTNTANQMVLLAEDTEAKVVSYGQADPRWASALDGGEPYLRFVHATGTTSANAQIALLEGTAAALVYRSTKISITGDQMNITPVEGPPSTWLRGSNQEVPDAGRPPTVIEEPHDAGTLDPNSWFIFGWTIAIPKAECTNGSVAYHDYVGEKAYVIHEPIGSSLDAATEALVQEILSENPGVTEDLVFTQPLDNERHLVMALGYANVQASSFPDCVQRHVKVGAGDTYEEAATEARNSVEWMSGYVGGYEELLSISR